MCLSVPMEGGSTNLASEGDNRLTLWYLDFGVSSHIIGNVNHFVSPQKYHGFTTVTMANREHRKITYTGFSKLSNGIHSFD